MLLCSTYAAMYTVMLLCTIMLVCTWLHWYVYCSANLQSAMLLMHCSIAVYMQCCFALGAVALYSLDLLCI